MTISLWGDKGPEFMTGLAQLKDVPIFVVITGLLAKTYFGTFTPIKIALSYYYLLLIVTSCLIYSTSQMLNMFNLQSLLCILHGLS